MLWMDGFVCTHVSISVVPLVDHAQHCLLVDMRVSIRSHLPRQMGLMAIELRMLSLIFQSDYGGLSKNYWLHPSETSWCFKTADSYLGKCIGERGWGAAKDGWPIRHKPYQCILSSLLDSDQLQLSPHWSSGPSTLVFAHGFLRWQNWLGIV